MIKKVASFFKKTTYLTSCLFIFPSFFLSTDILKTLVYLSVINKAFQ